MKRAAERAREIFDERRPTLVSQIQSGDLVTKDFNLYRVDKLGARHLFVTNVDTKKRERLPVVEKVSEHVHKAGHGHGGSDFYRVERKQEAQYDVVPEEFLNYYRQL